MELNPSLRSLEAAGRPSGTGRPSLPAAQPTRSKRAAPTNDPRPERGAEDRPSPAISHGKPDDHAGAVEAHAEAGRPVHEEGPSPSFESALERVPGAAAKEPSKPSLAAELVSAETTSTGALESAVPSLSAAQALGTAEVAELPLPPAPAAVPAPPADLQAVPLEAARNLPGDAPAPAAAEMANGFAVELAPEENPVEAAAAPLEAHADRSARLTETALFSARVAEADERPTSARVPTPEASTSQSRETRAAEILRQVRLVFAPRMEHAVIQLTPPDLGRIVVRLSVEDEGLVARVRAERRETLEALERHVPELRAALARQGIQTHRFDLALGLGSEARRDNARFDRPGATRGTGLDDNDTTNPEVLATVRHLLADGAVDTYA